jgi:hypothetical protein
MKKFSIHYQERAKLAGWISLAFNVAIGLLFVIIIILFQVTIQAPYLICGGAILLYDVEASQTLLLAYRSIFSSISIVLGVVLCITAIVLANYMPEDMYWVKVKLYALSLVGGLGMIGQAIYFLIITVTQSTPVNYASLSILLVLEIIPALLFVFVESVRNDGSRPSSLTKKSSNISVTR